MPDLQPRPELWGRPAPRIATAGSPHFRLPDATLKALPNGGGTVINLPLRGPDGKIPDAVADADILVSGGAVIDEGIASQLRQVRFVVRPYVGYDDIDVDALTRHGIIFANVPDAFIEEVANHTMALILAVNRRLLEADRFARSGRWPAGARNREDVTPIRRPSALTLGLVGFGNIARLVAERARPFGFQMVATDPFVSAEVAEAMDVSLLSMEQVLSQADILSVHVFLSAATRHLIDAERLALMKPTAYLINTSRGPVIDEAALIAALQSGKLAGAGLDVMEVEPLAADSPLLGLSNVILTPHIASYSIEGDRQHQARTAQIINQVVDGALPERKVVVNKDLYDALAEELKAAPLAASTLRRKFAAWSASRASPPIPLSLARERGSRSNHRRSCASR
jgi:D-3-phosphoglycerate dehydrogenase